MSKINDASYALFESLVKNYSKLVYKICFDVIENNDEAFDMSQETFLSLYNHLDCVKSLNEDEVKRYICKIALNKCKDYIRKNSYILSKKVNIDEIPEIDSNENIEEIELRKENKAKIIKAIQSLRSPYKELITMNYIDELTLDEISKKLNTKKSIIKTQISRAKKILKAEIERRKLL